MSISKQSIYDVHLHNINIQTRDIYLHSTYDTVDDGDEPGVEYRQATTFIKNLHFLDNAPNKPILVHIHSIGGCWDDGMAIFNSIQLARSKVVMVGYSQVSSMSGIIFQSPYLRIMMPDCHFMMHFGTSNSGSVHPFALRNYAKLEVQSCNRMLQIFAKRAINGTYFKKKKSSSLSSVISFFDKKLKKEVDWYLDAEKSIYYGLADGILGSEEYPHLDFLRKDSESNAEQKI